MNSTPLDGNHEEARPLPKIVVRFNLPSDSLRSWTSRLPKEAIGAPFLYTRKMWARAPKCVWAKSSIFMYDIELEVVDSLHFCETTRKRSYIHNLPIGDKIPLSPLTRKTISGDFPYDKNWWPMGPKRETQLFVGIYVKCNVDWSDPLCSCKMK
jgi:hypothetical protein